MVVLRVVTFAVTIMTLMWQVVLVVVGKRCGATESDTPKSGRSAGEQVTQSCLCRLLMSALHLYDIVLCSGVCTTLSSSSVSVDGTFRDRCAEGALVR